jgi:hypothetical protein
LEAILEAMPSAIALVEASTGRFTYINKRAPELYGFNYAGMNLEDHIAKVGLSKSMIQLILWKKCPLAVL